jgi:2-methylisocitrate lyase-like PEP mutase family enzyme
MTEPLQSKLSKPPIVVAPGIYDPLTALIATQAGFQTLYLSGAAIAYTRLGRPDIGLVSISEVAETVALIHDRVDADLIVDADTGYGNALNVERTVRLLERAGARAIQLEDQTFPKRCGHLDDKTLIPATEMAGKIKAAVDTRHSEQTLIIARTDAVAVEGLDAAIERAMMYRDAGADVLFVEAPKAREELAKIGSRIARAWLLAGDLPRRHRPRVGQSGARLLHLAGGQWHQHAVPRPHVRFRCAQRFDRYAGDDRARQRA